MQRCLQLAKNGLGSTYPNPLVGSVIVYNNKIIGEGWHYRAGQPHAEVLAIASVTDPHVLPEATLYVNLEPCSHFGKTPPCANLIIEKGIKKVVIGTEDPNTKVAGQGIQRLKGSGCEVSVGILSTECNKLNKRFFTFQNKKRPYIYLKWAQTLDGFIAPKERDGQTPVWITSNNSRQWVHKMRAEEQAILVGTNTVLEDNPCLTTRDWEGSSPLRVVLDRSLKIPTTARVFDDAASTLVLTEQVVEIKSHATYERINFASDLAQQICDILYRYGIQSLIVEGGSQTLQTFMDSGLWDEAKVFTGNTIFAQGIAAPKFDGKLLYEETLEGDLLQHFKNPAH